MPRWCRKSEMRMKVSRAGPSKAAFLAFFVLATTLIAGAQEYEIKLHRPAKVDQRFRVTAVGREFSDMKVVAEGVILKNQHNEFDLEYEGEMTVLGVGGNGRANSQSHKVIRLVKTMAGEKKTLLEPGTIVKAYREDKRRVFEIAGASVSKELNEALALAIDVGDTNSPTDDELIGTNDRKKIGDSWSANRATLEKLISRDSNGAIKISSGEFTLKEVVKDASGEALVVEGVIKAAANFPLPEGLKVKENMMTMNLNLRSPVDVTKPRSRDDLDLSFNIVASGKLAPEAPESTLTMTSKRTVKRTAAIAK
jgi:hypothetical protein